MPQEIIDDLLEDRKKRDRLYRILFEINGMSATALNCDETSKEMLESLRLIQNQLDLR